MCNIFFILLKMCQYGPKCTVLSMSDFNVRKMRVQKYPLKSINKSILFAFFYKSLNIKGK